MSDDPSRVPGGAIHRTHPFLAPESERNPVRRLRGRLTAPVTLWTAEAGTRAGLPVSSLLIVDGEPGRVLGLVDPDSEFWDVASDSNRFAVSFLTWRHRRLADVFAGLHPSPGGPFRAGGWTTTDWGPVPDGVSTWAGCTVLDARPMGWSLAVEAEIAHMALGDTPDEDPLLHRRGRYFTADPEA
ncbi:MAG TPA: flavin reductase family protein [Actinopolymorphaceae bacterium]